VGCGCVCSGGSCCVLIEVGVVPVFTKERKE